MSGSRSPMNLEKELEAAMPQTSPQGPRATRRAGTPVRDLPTGNPWEKMQWGDKKARVGHGPDSPFAPLLGQEGEKREEREEGD
eukprot:2530139-Pyramimonas_sp.AAC.1